MPAYLSLLVDYVLNNEAFVPECAPSLDKGLMDAVILKQHLLDQMESVLDLSCGFVAELEANLCRQVFKYCFSVYFYINDVLLVMIQKLMSALKFTHYIFVYPRGHEGHSEWMETIFCSWNRK